MFNPLKRLLPPFPEVQRPNFLVFRNPSGKVMERRDLRFENFFSLRVYNRRAKKYRFLANFALRAGFFLVSVLLTASVQRCFVSRVRDFFFFTFLILFLHIFERLKQNVFFLQIFLDFWRFLFLIIKFFGLFLVFFLKLLRDTYN